MSSKKLKYEKPMAMDMGAVSPVHGADCTSGFGASGACIATGHVPTSGCIGLGNNPDVAPVCFPGNVADYACETGNTTTYGRCSNGGGASGSTCTTGSTVGVT